MLLLWLEGMTPQGRNKMGLSHSMRVLPAGSLGIPGPLPLQLSLHTGPQWLLRSLLSLAEPGDPEDRLAGGWGGFRSYGLSACLGKTFGKPRAERLEGAHGGLED